ncbi:aminodeoxychorismate lyase [Pseudomonas sp. RIT-PI-AD]|uniref:aminodeoxychorismate lyase n=1 Tax=Pseudomonas sp. RIT-PI-AD TaxID=3035294 RepID=UPI0021D7E176|nr:aminodeoxychorismate lyase [Pseudomonas sp. RIT-PI-AD]
MTSWVDGQPCASLALADRGLAYGDGLFETIGVRAGRPRLLERHLSRLEDGARRLSIPLDRALVGREIQAFAALHGEAVIKLILTRGEGPRGYAAPAPVHPRRVLLGHSPAAYPARHAEEGVSLFPCVTRLAEQPLLAGLKHLNRLEQVLARAEWSDSRLAEGLLRDVHGRVIEGVYSNLFLARNGVLATADLSRCGVAGVMRAELIEQAVRIGVPVEVRDIPHEDLLEADEVFLCNSQYGVWPVRAIGEHRWPVGALTRKLQGIARGLLDS